MADKFKLKVFENIVMPHLDAAYNLARWLLHHHPDTEDVVQESFLRAFKFFDGFRGNDARVWLLAIVRNTCWTWLQKNGALQLTTPFDETTHSLEYTDENGNSWTSNPETLALQSASDKTLRAALEQLPVEFREVVILRELEGLSYKEIAKITGTPPGTVMSRLARGRGQLQHILVDANQRDEIG